MVDDMKFATFVGRPTRGEVHWVRGEVCGAVAPLSGMTTEAPCPAITLGRVINCDLEIGRPLSINWEVLKESVLGSSVPQAPIVQTEKKQFLSQKTLVNNQSISRPLSLSPSGHPARAVPGSISVRVVDEDSSTMRHMVVSCGFLK